MTQTTRIAFQVHGCNGLSAINIDTHQQIIFENDLENVQQFFKDTHADSVDRDRLNNGLTIHSHMSLTDWRAWDDAYGVKVSAYTWLTVCSCSQLGNAISAVCITDKPREVIALFPESTNFVNDCEGWNGAAFKIQESFTVRMLAETWALWLDAYEAAPLGGADELFENCQCS